MKVKIFNKMKINNFLILLIIISMKIKMMKILIVVIAK